MIFLHIINLSSDVRFKDSTHLLSVTTSAKIMRIWCQIVPLWVPFEHSFRLQPHSPNEVTSKNWTLIIPFIGEIKDLHCLIRPCTTCVQAISCFLWLTVFSPNVNTYPLGSLLTNRNLPHSQKASRNDFHEPLGQAVPLPLRVSLTCPGLSCPHYYQVPTTQAKPA